MPTYTHDYTIASLPRKDIGADKQVITEIHVRIGTSDGTYDDNRPFVHTFSDLEAPFTPFDDLTKADILAFIPADTKAGWEAAMENRVAGIAAKAAANECSEVPA